MTALELLTRDYLGNFAFRWLHVLAGITWIGLLYYFNFVQVPALAAYGDEGKARNMAINQIARRALWWFRWASVATLVTGILITGLVKGYFKDFMSADNGNGIGHNVAISIGMVLGITMAANVWMVIWKNQRLFLQMPSMCWMAKKPTPMLQGLVVKHCSLHVKTWFFSVNAVLYDRCWTLL